MGLGLAVGAGSALSKIGWGLTGLSAISAVPMIDDMAYKTRERILTDGPNADGNFRTNWWQNLLIDEQSLKPQYEKRKYETDTTTGKHASTIAEIERLVGAQFKPGMNASAFVNQNRGALSKAQLQETFNTQEQLAEMAHNSPRAVAAREKEDRRWYAQQQRLLRQDRAALRLDEQRLDLQKQQQHNEMVKHNRELQLHREDKRRDQWLAVASGLQALGGAFAM